MSAALFDILGTEAMVGRTFDEAEERGQATVAVLGYDLWQRRFAADPHVVGSTLELDGTPYEVVGVLRRDFRFPVFEADLWVPFTPNPAVPRRARGVRLVGRLAPGVGAEQAQAELDRIATQWQQQYPDVYPADSGWGIHLQPIREQLAGDVRPLLLALFAAVLLVLLIACANVANLLLAQAAARGREISLRTALGAERGTLVRQLLTESLLLGLAGGGLGIIFAGLGQRALVALDLGEVSRVAAVTLDGRVLAFAVAVSVATGLLFGLAPAWSAFRPDLVGNLKEGGRSGSMAGARSPLRSALVVAEVGLAVVVLVGAGLMLRSFQRLAAVDPGFRTEGMLTAELSLSGRAYPTSERRLDLYRRLLDRLDAAPQVRRAAVTSNLPLSPGLTGSPQVEGWEPSPGEVALVVGYQVVSPSYFEVMGLERVDGRLFTDADNDQGPRVVIVDDELARRYWPGASPLGRHLALPGLTPPGEWLQVVGVVDSLAIDGLSEYPERRLYLPYAQLPSPTLEVVAQTAGAPLAAAGALRQAVWGIDPQIPIPKLRDMHQALAESTSRPRVNAVLFTVFAAVALLLAALGVYGVMAYSVSQRTREIGVRMSLGAERGRVLALVLRRGMVLTVSGLVLGLVATVLLVRTLESTLDGLTFGIAATDLVTLVSVPLVLALVAFLACWWPARRATRVNPTEALRYE